MGGQTFGNAAILGTAAPDESKDRLKTKRLSLIDWNKELLPYKGAANTSGVIRYRSGREWIIVQFREKSPYLYTYESTGESEIEKMKQLAQAGRGLATYITRHVKKRYAAKL